MELRNLGVELEALARDGSLEEEVNLRARAAALDHIALVDEVVRLRGEDASAAALCRQAAALRHRLEAVDERLFQRLRGWIQSGKVAPSTLRREFDRYTGYVPSGERPAHLGYDGLDHLIDGLLCVEPVPRKTVELAPEMVHLETTPARAILDLVDHASLTPSDVLVDIGSGLGQVAILVHLLSGIETRGIEIDPAFCRYARRCVRALGLTGIEFVPVDARDADYTTGTVFYLFTPFVGDMLQAVLDRLRAEARVRSIRVCTYGPCTPHVARQPWLACDAPDPEHEFKLAVFHSWPA
jgi:hypothetical protein